MSKIIKIENTMSVRDFASKKKVKSFKLTPYTNKEGVRNIGAVFTVGDKSVWMAVSAPLKEIWSTAKGNDCVVSTMTNEAGEKYPMVHLVGQNDLLAE